MANYEVAELTWENGQLAMHELGGMFSPTASTLSSLPKPTWGSGGGGGRAGDTLESIVHQATCCNKINPNSMPTSTTQVVMGHSNMDNVAPVVAPSGGKRAVNSGTMQPAPPPPPPSRLVKKRMREPNDRESACASASASANAVFCGENNDTTMITWASHESPRSCTRTKTTTDEDSACHGGSENQEEGREIKSERGRSYTTRKGRAAAVHNQSERRRRDRINQKMKALQKLVPNASKTDKASMLDEVIDYLKQLQAQVQMMSNARFMPQIMMPLGMQQHLQMSLLARMGMGMGMGTGIGMGMGIGMGIGMLDTPQAPVPLLIQPTQVATAASGFVPPAAFVVPQMVPTAVTQQPGPDQGASTSGSSQDPYSTLLAQSMNIDLYNRMAALQRQQQQQQMIAQPASTQLQLNHQHVQGS